MATEWDLRIDVGNDWEPNDLIDNLHDHIPSIQYGFISAVESADPGHDRMHPGSRSATTHVHCGLILHQPAVRASVIRMMLNREENDLPTGAVYCAVRNQRYSYGGWVAHHGKTFTKLNPTTTNLLWEHGSLPREWFSTVGDAQLLNWIKTINRHATPYWRERLEYYQEELSSRQRRRVIT